MKQRYPRRGYLGYFGQSSDKVYNDKLIKANELRNKHCSLINSFSTEEENDIFDKQIRKEIDDILKKNKMKCVL